VSVGGANGVYLQNGLATLDTNGNFNLSSGSYRRGGTSGGIYVPLPGGPFWVADTGGWTYNGTSARGTGYYTITVNGNGNPVPAGAKAVYIRAGGDWPTASNGSYMLFYDGGSAYGFAVRAATTYTQEASGIVNVNSSNQIVLQVAGATINSPYIAILGYFY
jgi:hypothetical protein